MIKSIKQIQNLQKIWLIRKSSFVIYFALCWNCYKNSIFWEFFKSLKKVAFGMALLLSKNFCVSIRVQEFIQTILVSGRLHKKVNLLIEFSNLIFIKFSFIQFESSLKCWKLKHITKSNFNTTAKVKRRE